MSDHDDSNSSVEDLLRGITREDGTQKYGNIEDALKALVASQQHIQTLESENKTIKEQMTKIDQIEATLNRLNSSPPKDQGTPPASPDTGTLDLAKIQELVAAQFREYSQQTQKQRNQESFEGKLKQSFGDDFKNKVAMKATELGVSYDFLKDLAGTSPAAALKLLEEKTVVSPVQSEGGQRPSRFSPPQTPVNIATMNTRERVSVIEDRIRQMIERGGN